MDRTLIVKHTKDRKGRPLACVHGLPGDGADLSAPQLRLIASALNTIADECDCGAGLAYAETATYDMAALEQQNPFVAYRAEITGGYLEVQGVRRGFALLSRLIRGRLTVGKIVECWLDAPDSRLLQDAIRLLVGQLRQENVDLIEAYGGSRWRDEALRMAGFRLVDHLDLRVRDRVRALKQLELQILEDEAVG